VSFLRPFLLRAASTLRPLAEAMRSRKPCLLVLFLREGWNVRFIILSDKPQFLKGCKNGQELWILQDEVKGILLEISKIMKKAGF